MKQIEMFDRREYESFESKKVVVTISDFIRENIPTKEAENV